MPILIGDITQIKQLDAMKGKDPLWAVNIGSVSGLTKVEPTIPVGVMAKMQYKDYFAKGKSPTRWISELERASFA